MPFGPRGKQIEEGGTGKMGQAIVTVVIPAYNYGRFLPRAIHSVLAQTISNWMLMIIDDGSTDDTEQVVQPFLSDPRIHYVKQKRRGLSYSLKHALSIVQTKYMAQLDADDWYEPITLESCIDKMEKSSQIVAMVYANEKIWKLRKEKLKFKKWKKKRPIRGKYDFITYHPMVYPRFYRTEALRKVGGWKTNVPYGGRYAEDRQILLKLAGKYKFKWINQYLYNHLSHKANNSRQSNRLKYARVTRHLYHKALKRWGNKYRAKFVWVHGRLKVGKLIRKRG